MVNKGINFEVEPFSNDDSFKQKLRVHVKKYVHLHNIFHLLETSSNVFVQKQDLQRMKLVQKLKNSVK